MCFWARVADTNRLYLDMGNKRVTFYKTVSKKTRKSFFEHALYTVGKIKKANKIRKRIERDQRMGNGIYVYTSRSKAFECNERERGDIIIKVSATRKSLIGTNTGLEVACFTRVRVES